MYDPYFPSMPRWNTPCREALKCNKAVGGGYRIQHRSRFAASGAVNIGAAQRDDQRALRVSGAKCAYALRAARCVQRNHEVCRLAVIDMSRPDAVAEFPEDSRPPFARCSVSRP